ncbi:MAG: LacI family DNA-binding transcriptional regulator [Rhizobiaceae bacterium]|nr:LacI family DNA-binding transcriptional regulator [Rhizobiaceae bacterium]
MKVTVSAIAQSCGLSTATVDRALNNRSGISAANRQRVMEAAQRLGYLPTAGSVTRPSRPAHLEFLIPIRQNAFMAELARHIEEHCGRLPLVASCRIKDLADISPASLQAAADQTPLGVKGVGVVAIDHPRTRNTLQAMVEAGIRIVTIASDVPTTPRSAYVGLDNRVAGRTAALLMGRLLRGLDGNVAIVTGSRSYRGHEEREMGFRAVLGEEFGALSVATAVDINEDAEASYVETRKLLDNDRGLLGIYCVGAGRAGVARAIGEVERERRPVFICHDLTRLTRGYLIDDIADVVIDQNARLTAEQAVIQLLGSIASPAPFLTNHYIEPRLIFKENIPTL